MPYVKDEDERDEAGAGAVNDEGEGKVARTQFSVTCGRSGSIRGAIVIPGTTNSVML